MGNVVSIEGRNKVTRSCLTCKFRLDDPLTKSAQFWLCGISGRYCTTEEFDVIDGCGTEKSLWVERPPDPPTFLQRLGDAIIERIKGSKS